MDGMDEIVGIVDGRCECEGCGVGRLDGWDDGLLDMVGRVEMLDCGIIVGKSDGSRGVEGKLVGLKDGEGKAVG